MRGRRADARTVVAVVSGGHFLSHFYLLALPPLFPLLVDDFAVSNAQLGLIMSMIYLAMFLLQIPAGELVDRLGAKTVFVLGVVLSALGTMLVGLATSYAHLLAFAFVAGIGQSAFHPADYALLDAVTDEAAEGKSFGVHTFTGFVGFAAAPPVVGALGLGFGWQPALLAVGAVGLGYAVVSALAMAPVYRLQLAEAAVAAGSSGGADEADTGPSGRDRLGSLSLLTRPAVLAMFAFFVVVTVSDIGIQTFTAIFLVEGFGFSEAVGNAALTFFLAATAVGVLAGGWLADTYDFYRVMVVSLVAAGVGIGVGTTPLAGSGPVVAVGVWTVAGFCFGLALPSRDRAINALTAPGDTGKSFGIVYTGLPLGGFIGPAVIGVVIDTAGLFSGFALNAVFYVAAAGIILAFVTGAVSAGAADEVGESA